MNQSDFYSNKEKLPFSDSIYLFNRIEQFTYAISKTNKTTQKNIAITSRMNSINKNNFKLEKSTENITKFEG